MENSRRRIPYIDAFRGFVMLIVVFQHIRAFGFGLMEKDSVLSMIYLTFMLPSFFLISGFTSYREDISRESIYTILSSRFRQLVIPTIVFLTIHNLLGYDKWSFPGGYWFTYVLFIIISLQTLVQKFFSDKWHITVLIIISFVFFCLRGYYGSRLDSGWVKCFSFRLVFTFFQYYVLGVIVKKYYQQTVELIDKAIFRNIIVIAVAVGLLFSEHLSVILSPFQNSLYHNILSFVTTFFVFCMFYNLRTLFESGNLFTKSLIYVGRRTLDLYMIHYFFIPSLVAFGFWFVSTGNCSLELIIVGGLTIIVSALSLFVSMVLKFSPILNYWLFGSRTKRKS